MIVDAIVRFVGQSVRAVLNLLPSWTPPFEEFGSQATAIGAMASRANGYFPVAVLGWCLVLVLSLKVLLFGWRVIVFIYHQVWGSN